MSDLRRIALAQVAPKLGDLESNLAMHHDVLDDPVARAADLVVFPELSLTGYLLSDLAADVAMRRDDPRLLDLAKQAGGRSVVVGFVEESDDHRLFVAGALLEGGQVAAVHRKIFLPTYGLFDERRFFAPGEAITVVESALGVPLGLAICEDFWHMAVPQAQALDGAQVLINIASSPGRGIAASEPVGLGSAGSWWGLSRTYAQLTTSFVIFANRVGLDEALSFWGGSEVISPTGEVLFKAPLYDEGVYGVEIDLAEVRRERISLPLLRDERPELQLRELGRIATARRER